MKNKILAITLVSMLAVSSISVNAFAETTTESNQNQQMKERLEKPENEIFGKITAISENSVTISVAEMKKPENIGQNQGIPPERPENGGRRFGTPKDKPQNDNNQNGNRPERKQLTDAEIAEMKKKFEESITLTGETKTIDISSANFNDFGRGKRDGNRQNENNNASTETNNNKIEKSYKDYQVGDYISIELTDKNSTTAKSVRGAGMMRGMEPPKDRNNNLTQQ